MSAPMHQKDRHIDCMLSASSFDLRNLLQETIAIGAPWRIASATSTRLRRSGQGASSQSVAQTNPTLDRDAYNEGKRLSLWDEPTLISSGLPIVTSRRGGISTGSAHQPSRLALLSRSDHYDPELLRGTTDEAAADTLNVS